MTSPDDYEALHERAAVGAIADRRQVAVAGPDRAPFLHGLLTNDTEIDGMPVVVARIDQLNVPGYVVYTDVQQEAAVTKAIMRTGVLHATPQTLEAVRIEAAYPIFGIDMTTDTIPLEAGIEDRAISFTKGCYVGQEVIIRVMHRGHGRVARKLVRLQLEGTETPMRDAKVFDGEREVGFITSAAQSPRLGTIALGYLHRDFVEAGTAVDVQAGDTRVRAH